MLAPRLRPLSLCIGLALATGFVASAQASHTRVTLDAVDKLDPSRSQSQEHAASFATADRIVGDGDSKVELIGNAEVRRAGTVITGEHITYDNVADEVTVTGNAKISRQGASFTGPSMSFKLTSREGTMAQAEWEYGARRLRGCAKNVHFLSGESTTFEDVTITTCKRDNDDWYISLNSLEVDEYDQSATGTGAVLHFMGVPMLGSPWFSLPISTERRSGFLTPSYGMSSTRGVELALPYYFNIAPNYDYTLTPRIMSKRGVMIGNEVRFLTSEVKGQIDLDFLPNDRVMDEDRYSVRVQGDWHHDKFGFSVDYNRVSDDDYISDFSGNIRESSESVLPQDYAFTYTDTYWDAMLRVTKNQTLDIDSETPYFKPYERLPQLRLNASNGDWHGFELSTTIDATRFHHPDRIGGSRFVFDQSVIYPLEGPGWFVRPKAQFLGVWYDLDDTTSYYKDRSPSRTLPIMSLDAGLVFERDSHWFGRDAFQTLEPRIYYAWAPYRNQNALPIFDTSIADLNFTTLFTENVFAGYDRVSEANQLTAVMSTRYIDKTSGLELFRASIGQRQYFSDQRVTYIDPYWNQQYGPQDTGQRQDVRSDLLASVAARLTQTISTSATAQYSSADSRFVKINAGVQWSPKRMSFLGVYYRYNYAPEVNYDNIRQIDFAAQWPLTDRLYALARYNYSLYGNKPIEMIGGFEYLADCWTLRFVAQRYTTTSNQDETNFFLQLELSGLGSVGTNPISELARNIKGYQTRSSVPNTTQPYDYYE